MLKHLAALAFLTFTAIGAAQPAANADEQAIHELERQWNEARVHADLTTLGRILVDDWTVTHGDGTTDSKAKYLADLKSGARKFSGSVTEHDVVIRLYSDTAVASGSSDSTVTINGQPQGGALHFTRVYIRRNGAWRMIVSQATTRR